MCDWNSNASKRIVNVISYETFSLSDCKGRALRKVQEKDSARVKGEAP